jgi:hypothetical protein
MTSRDELIRKLLRSRCEWPECVCAEKWSFWVDTFERWDRFGQPQFTDEDIEDILVSMVSMLACVATHCTDRRARQHAQVQLLHPVFAEARGKWPN